MNLDHNNCCYCNDIIKKGYKCLTCHTTDICMKCYLNRSKKCDWCHCIDDIHVSSNIYKSHARCIRQINYLKTRDAPFLFKCRFSVLYNRLRVDDVILSQEMLKKLNC